MSTYRREWRDEAVNRFFCLELGHLSCSPFRNRSWFLQIKTAGTEQNFELKPFYGRCLPLFLTLPTCLFSAWFLFRSLVPRVFVTCWGSKRTYLSFFPREGRQNLVIAVPSDGGNVLTKENLVKALGLFEEISAITTTVEVSSVA